MDKKQWSELSLTEQNSLAAKYGITRSGLNNQVVGEEELLKIPKKDEVSKKKTVKLGAKKAVKLGNGRRVAVKSKSGRKK